MQDRPQEFDYVIVGAGSAGCVLASRLSENGRFSVLLTEAGGSDAGLFVRMPMGLFKNFGSTARSWHYHLDPDPMSGKAHFWIRGRMLGGSSSLNGMLYFRGHPEDYNEWERQGCTGWGWGTMRRAFRAIEDHELGDDGVRGVGGPLHISVQQERTPLTEAILAAGSRLGVPIRDDLNREDQEGIAYSTRTMKGGRRVSAASAFLKPALGRPNLTVVLNCLAQKLTFSRGRADGVQCLREGRETTFRARREVIVSAGALQSPVLLQHSGIGPAAHLSRLGIPVVLDNPHVGAHAREHKTVTIEWRVTGHSLNARLRPPGLWVSALRYLLNGSGPLAATYDINAFVRTAPGLERPDAQLTFWALSRDRDAADTRPEAQPGLSFMGYPLRTDSEGRVLIRSADPAEPPSIQANFLSTEHDREKIVGLFRFVRRMAHQEPLQKFLVAETSPGPAVQTDDEIIAACHQGSTCMHTVATCRMGQGDGSVVDPRLRVRGVEGLRVVDCSVMPTQVSGNTNGPVMALAWRASELILEDVN